MLENVTQITREIVAGKIIHSDAAKEPVIEVTVLSMELLRTPPAGPTLRSLMSILSEPKVLSSSIWSTLSLMRFIA
jgi:hypothetical protein